MQRGSHATVMRVIPSKVPSFAELNLPAELQHIVGLRNDRASDGADRIGQILDSGRHH